MSKNPIRRAKMTVEISVGESVRLVRELQGLSQNQLATLTGIPQSTISGEVRIDDPFLELGGDSMKTSVLPPPPVWTAFGVELSLRDLLTTDIVATMSAIIERSRG